MSGEQSWPGCHGVRLPGSPIELGRSTGDPVTTASVRIGDAGDPSGDEVWRVELEVEIDGASVLAEQRLWRRPDGTLHVRNNRGGALSVDVAASAIDVDGRDDAVLAQLLATYGLPLLLHDAGVLVVHASAFEVDQAVVLVGGPSGRGKSSVLVAAIDAGHRPVSEDLCAIDLRGPAPLVWPGPPWVRRRRGEPGPEGAEVRFETPDKTAWDIAGRQAPGPLPLARIVGLEAPGGSTPSVTSLGRAEALSRLASHTVWLGEPARREVALFDAVASVSGAVPFASLRLPFSSSWLDGVPAILAGALA